MNSDGGLESACFTGQIPLRATFIGGNLDAANAFSLWGMRWAEHLGVHEDRGRLPAPRPVIELFVYCPEESVELAYAVRIYVSAPGLITALPAWRMLRPIASMPFATLR